MLDWVKNNPMKTAGLILLFVVLYLFMNNGGSSGTTVVSTSPGYDPTTVQAGMALQAQQLNAQTQLAALNTQANAQADQVAAAVAVANLQAQTVQQQNTLAAQTTQQQNTLAAQVANQSLSTQQAIAESSNSLQAAITASNNNTTLQIAQMQQVTQQAVVAAGVQQAQINADVSKTAIQGQTDIAQINSGGMCFITTAFVEILGKDDKCDELQILREYRDGAMMTVPGGKQALDNYYVIGPAVAEWLRKMDTKESAPFAAIYWCRVIKPACLLITRGYDHAAFVLYKAMIEELQLRANLA